MRLVRAAATARADEVRHARTTWRLARRYGGRPIEVRALRPATGDSRATRLPRAEPRALEAIAAENAVEGCVGETFGALLAMHQAMRATDPGVRMAMRSIAVDETRHAALAWAVAKWMETKLSGEARARVREARRTAVATLRDELARGAPAKLVAYAGVPARDVALQMIDALTASLWADAPSSH